MMTLAPLSLAVSLAAGHSPVLRLGSDSMFGVRAGLFFPTSAALKDVMGDRWFSFGLARVRKEARGGTKLVIDLEMIRNRNGDNKVAMLTPSATLLKDFAEPGATTFPYVGVGLGLTYFDYSLRANGVYQSTKRVGPSVNLQAGYVIDSRFVVSIRYNWMPSYDGFGFSGFTISAGYGFIKF